MFVSLLTLLLFESDSIGVDVDAAGFLNKTIQEVVVTGRATAQANALRKGAETIDEHLDKFAQVQLLKRGAYASEVLVNSMTTERVSTTIDGMKIFCACTDKMDPVTSYVESTNLSSLRLNQGLGSDPQATGNLGGSIDLRLRKAGFDALPHEVNLQTQYQSNASQQAYLLDAAWSSHRFYLNAGVGFRKAGNYDAGGHRKIDFSGFQKVNVFSNGGWQLTDNQALEYTMIYDVATDVGYPALTMDVKEAKGFISALSYRKEQFGYAPWVRLETKVYYNQIDHAMDDTRRPDVVMHMDMPGLSRTAGFYALLLGQTGNHSWQTNLDGYWNRSRASMTMYPDTYGTPEYNPADRMFMLTWPDVVTGNVGWSASDQWRNFRLSVKGALQRRIVTDTEALSALRIYYPHLEKQQNRQEGRIALQYYKELAKINLKLGSGWGVRTPTVTETYGYFLYNVADGYDYLGNPDLKNEQAFEWNASARWYPFSWLEIEAEGNFFHFKNYILGQLTEASVQYSAMTIGAAGVKQYRNLPHAQLANASITVQAKWLRAWTWRHAISYAWGCDHQGNRLPLIAPWQYESTLQYRWAQWEAEARWHLAARRTHVAFEQGEQPTAGYGLLNVQAGYLLQGVPMLGLSIKAGIENVFDKYYTTYAQWNGIAQPGRNLFLGLQLSF